MESIVESIKQIETTTKSIANTSFPTPIHPVYSVRNATDMDKQWIDKQIVELREKRTIESIIEEINRYIAKFSITEYQIVVQRIQLQYTSLTNQIALYKDQIERYEGEGKESYITQKQEEIIKAYKEEEAVIEAEIRAQAETIENYASKIEALKKDDMTLTSELTGMLDLLTKYKTLVEKNEKLQTAVDKEKKKVEDLHDIQKKTIGNMLTLEEGNELQRKRTVLDQSEREEAELMSELEGLMKQMDSTMQSSLSLSFTSPNQKSKKEREEELAVLKRRRELLKEICKVFVEEGKENGNKVAVAMSILLQHDGNMLLADLKNEMKTVLGAKEASGVLPAIYSLVGNQIVRIDRTSEQRIICTIYLVCKTNAREGEEFFVF